MTLEYLEGKIEETGKNNKRNKTRKIKTKCNKKKIQK